MNKLDLVIPKGNSWEELLQQKLLPPFATVLTNFAQDLSKQLLQQGKSYPELMALGFWLRRANLSRLELEFTEKNTFDQFRLPRGLVFHIAPANVDTLFVYSWMLALLVGNKNFLRLPTLDTPQLNLLLAIIGRLLGEDRYVELSKRNMLVRYGHIDEINRKASINCDVRVLWGGDGTVESLRKFPLPPTARELNFADKFSLALLDAQEVLDCKSFEQLIQHFCNDAFGFDQRACSSPRLVIWIGSEYQVKQAQEKFWWGVQHRITEQPPPISLHLRMEKLVTQYQLSIEDGVQVPVSTTAYVNRIELPSLDKLPTDLHCGGGLFYEFSVHDLEELIPVFSKKIQTISIFGVSGDNLRQLLSINLCAGVDRIVPIGKALDFHHHWDGYDLLSEFSRSIIVSKGLIPDVHSKSTGFINPKSNRK